MDRESQTVTIKLNLEICIEVIDPQQRVFDPSFVEGMIATSDLVNPMHEKRETMCLSIFESAGFEVKDSSVRSNIEHVLVVTNNVILRKPENV